MGRFSVWDVCLMFWVVLLKHSDAEPLYFIQNYSETWDDARIECQRCFKDLATVMPNTTNIIASNLSSDYYWIGLRKHFPPLSNFTDVSDSNSSSGLFQAWSQWANGDPLAFQNWYPGWPKFKPNPPKISCCSCSCTCPAATDPVPTSVTQFDVTNSGIDNTSYFNTTNLNAPDFNQPTISSAFTSLTPPVASQCEKSPMLLPEFTNPDRDYIEDSCVTLLRNGAWVETNCSDLLPFVCYDDRFYGQANVSNVSSSAAVLTWLPAPGNIRLYRLKVTIHTNLTDVVHIEDVQRQPFNFTYALQDLEPGSRYTATVVAVTCERDVDDPQEVTFYTIPRRVANLSVVTQTEASVTLRWIKPDVNVDFYRIRCDDGTENDTFANGTVVHGLTPGTRYKFTVWTGVNDTSKWSEPADVSAYTRPANVTNLQVVYVNKSSLHFSWTNPKGRFTGFNVTVAYSNNNTIIFNTWNQTSNSSSADNLPPGTQVNVSVTVLGNEGLESDAVHLVSYTAPDPVSDLTLVTTSSSVNASWSYSATVYSPFELQLQPMDSSQKPLSTYNHWFKFDNLTTAVRYTVTVRSVVGNTYSEAKNCSSFTLPLQPENVSVMDKSTNNLTFKWDPPAKIGTGNYSVSLSSSFWGQTLIDTTTKTQYTFSNLKSGSMYSFEVRTLAGDLRSDATTNSTMTVSQPVQINLAILCSSAEPLYCAQNGSTEVFEQLKKRIFDKLGNNVSWELTHTTRKTSP